MDVYEKDYRLRFHKVTVKDYGLILGGVRGKYRPLSGREERAIIKFDFGEKQGECLREGRGNFLPSNVEICKRELPVPEE